MDKTMDLATLVEQLQELESETFEVHDYAEDADLFIPNPCSSSSTSSTTSSCCA
jgi:hypothetical protein